MLPIDVAQITAQNQPTVAIRRGCAAWLPVAEAVEETAEDAAFAGKGRARCGRVGALAGDGLLVVGADDGFNDAGLIKVLRAFDPGHVADKHAVADDLGFKAGRAVGVHSASRRPGSDTRTPKGVDHPAGPEFVHARKVAFAPEESLNVRKDA